MLAPLFADSEGPPSAAETTLWSGAGISADPPTCGPLGPQLTTRAFRAAFLPETPNRISHYYGELGLRRSSPRLETLLDVLVRTRGTDALVDLLEDLRKPPPNNIHRFCAAHLEMGGSHVTANFDPCIESVLANGSRASMRLVHFHGSFAADPSGESLAATLHLIDRGFPEDIASQVDGVLVNDRTSLVMFLGYSGSDFFDVDPHLRALAETNAMQGKTALWVQHSGEARIASGDNAAARQRQLAYLAAAGARVHYVEAPTREVLAFFADAWGLERPKAPSEACVHWQPPLALSEDERRQASLELFAHMGLHREVDRLTPSGPQDEGERLLVAQTRWAQGRYGEAAAMWREAYANSGSPWAWASAAERAAACLWIRGRHQAAWRQVRAALRKAESGDATDEQRLLLAEMAGRIFLAMKDFPDGRLFATPRRRRDLLALLEQLRSAYTRSGRLGTHLSARITSVQRRLGASIVSHSELDAVEAFGEFEALHAQLNFRYYHFSELQRAGGKRPSDVAPHEYRDLMRHFDSIGAFGDAARVPVLRGASREFSLGQIYSRLRELDITRWHRVRLLGRALSDRL
jgi:hypothetical protein